jgi:hypothetical protein
MTSSFKRWGPGCCDCHQCEIGFIGSEFISLVVDGFPDAHANTDVTAANLNSSVWGADGDQPLDVLYWGYPYNGDSCEPLTEPDWLADTESEFLAEINTFISGGGKMLIIGENTAPIPYYSGGCLEEPDVIIYNKLLANIGSTMQLLLGYNIDFACHQFTNIVTTGSTEAEQAVYDAITDNVTKIGMGGTGAISGGLPLIMSIEDDTKANTAIEKIGDGYVLFFADSNMLVECNNNSDIETLLGNFCSLGSS